VADSRHSGEGPWASSIISTDHQTGLGVKKRKTVPVGRKVFMICFTRHIIIFKLTKWVELVSYNCEKALARDRVKQFQGGN
jgi:hypothetical protein